MKNRKCVKCSRSKPLSDFYNKRKTCKVCQKIYRDEYYQKNKTLLLPKNQDQALIRKYGITKKDWDILFQKQKGCCAICGRHQGELKHTLHTDHDHSTGEVRGLLCKSCNYKLGWYENLRSRIEGYL